uniref:Uncharacterized protein n=2 Tax=Rhodosorus marinus TaxID=101924 RepID=A0A7S3ACC5_9RHOD|mmetsp:Transcript_9767/g.41805  ORF Transcript_9767/g.41805 Transcript_9767/m.41805 type:complete len:292 (+) Transcript_9767:107-982(+)
MDPAFVFGCIPPGSGGPGHGATACQRRKTGTKWIMAAEESEASSEKEKYKLGKVSAPRASKYGKRKFQVGNVKQQGKKYVEYVPAPQLRITGGSAKGRKLTSPDVYMRPMMGKVREAVYSMLYQFDALEGGMAVDMFCGSGSVGLEALSRGLDQAVFVDLSPVCTETCEKNVVHCGFEGRGRAINCTAEQMLLHPERYGVEGHAKLITLTPPYEEVDYGELMYAAAGSDLVGEGTFLVVEYPVELGSLEPAYRHRLVGIRNRKYGRTVIAIYACQPPRFVDPRPDEFASPV